MCDPSREKIEELLLTQLEKELVLQHHDKDFIDKPPCHNKAEIEKKNDDTDDKLYQRIVLWTVLHLLRNIFEKQEQQMKGEGIHHGAIINKENNVLPISTKDLADINTSQEKALNLREFLRFACNSVINIPPEQHGALLLLCGSFLGYQVKNLSTPFDIQSGTINSSSSLLLSFGEAFIMFLPEMAHITKFILCYFLTVILVWPLQLGVQLILMFLLISAPFYYFPELAHKASASRIDVDCGSLFKLPLIWFAIFGAISLSLICGLITLVMVYFSWRQVVAYDEKGPKLNTELKVSVDALSGVLVG